MKSLSIFVFLLLQCWSLDAQWIIKTNFGSGRVQGDIEYVSSLINSGEAGAAYQLTKYLFADARVGFSQLRGIGRFARNTSASLQEEVYQDLGTNNILPNYKKNYGYMDLAINISPTFREGSVRFELGAGVGSSFSKTWTNLRDEDGEFYNMSSTFIPSAKERLALLDDTYETVFPNSNTVQLHAQWFAGLSISVADNTFLGASIKRQYPYNDYIDTIKFPSFNGQDLGNDSVTFFMLTLSTQINILEF